MTGRSSLICNRWREMPKPRSNSRVAVLAPDRFFIHYQADFPAHSRDDARRLFRRAIRDFYVMQARYVVDPESGRRVPKVFLGESIQLQKNQRRKAKKFFTGRVTAGRPQRPEIKLLVARLFILWGRYATTPTSFSWKTELAKSTRFEDFLFDLLPKVGAPDVRRYVETHWRERSKNKCGLETG